MKRTLSGSPREGARRAQRLALLRHDVPSAVFSAEASRELSTPSSTAPAPLPPVSAPVDMDAVKQLVTAEISSRMDALLQANALAAPVATPSVGAVVAVESPPVAAPVVNAPLPRAVVVESAAPLEDEPSRGLASAAPAATAPATTAPAATAMPTNTTGVRVVTRNQISGDAALESSSSLARRAPSRSTQPELSPRCLAHTGLHYQGATQEDVLAAWQAMRDRYRLEPENKVLPRRALIDWLKNQRTVCPDSVYWYGDFVVIRSCPVRSPEGHAAAGVDGWWVLFDPNGDGYLRTSFFADAFDAPDSRFAGVVPRLVRPAWISEERRLAAAARAGKADARPFSTDSVEDLGASDFTRGLAE